MILNCVNYFQELVAFMSKMRGNKVKFEPKKIVLTAGATAGNETLIFCLAEPGEAFLIPTPYYPGYNSYHNNFINRIISTIYMLSDRRNL